MGSLRTRVGRSFTHVFAVAVGTAVVVAMLLLQAQHPAWSRHLSSDVGVFASRVWNFYEVGSWEGLRNNEYQPGALYFFLLPSFFERFGISYLQAFLWLNVLLLVLHVAFLLRTGGAPAAGAALLLFLAAGPIVLYRFELLVSLLVLLAFKALPRYPFWSGALLGLATAVKVYPIVLLPLFVLSCCSTRNWRPAARLFLGFGLSLAGVLAAYFLAGGNFQSMLEGLQYHGRKPVAVYSLLGALVVLWDFFGQGVMPTLTNTYGIHGFVVSSLPRSVATFSLIGALFIGYALAFLRRKRRSSLNNLLPILLTLLTMVVLPFGLQPQYLLWPLAFIALAASANLPRVTRVTVVGLHAAALFLIQFFYPVGFDRFLAELSGAVPPSFLVFLSVVSMVLLCIEYGLVWNTVKKMSA